MISVRIEAKINEGNLARVVAQYLREMANNADTSVEHMLVRL